MKDTPRRFTVRSRLPPLNALRAFDATARHLTVVQAAAELSVTPSAVSHQLRTLEDFLGVQLFNRNKARLKLTAQGDSLLPSIRAAFQMIASASAGLNDAAMVGMLTVSIPVGLASRLLTQHVGEFLRQYPDVRFRVIASNDDKEVYLPSVDICIRYGTGTWSERQVRLLSSVDLFPVGSPAMLNGVMAVRTAADLKRHVLLCEDAGAEWTRWLLAAGMDTDGFRMTEMGNAHIAIEAALHGQGIALADSMLVGDDLSKGRLMRVLDGSVPAKHAYYLVCRHEVCESPLVAAFTEWVLRKVRTVTQDGN